jgi:hypothetical protein
VGGLVSADRIEPVRLERMRKSSLIDAVDRYVVGQVLTVLVLVIVAAAAVGAAVRAFLWASGLGG